MALKCMQSIRSEKIKKFAFETCTVSRKVFPLQSILKIWFPGRAVRHSSAKAATAVRIRWKPPKRINNGQPDSLGLAVLHLSSTQSGFEQVMSVNP